MKETLKILVAAGFSNSEISEFSAQNRVDYIAHAILQGIACKCKPWVHYEPLISGGPFEAMAGMSAEERRELRAYATADFSEFISEIKDASVSQAKVNEEVDRLLAFYASRGIYPSSKRPS
jgi:hypothetical protein